MCILQSVGQVLTVNHFSSYHSNHWLCWHWLCVQICSTVHLPALLVNRSIWYYCIKGAITYVMHPKLGIYTKGCGVCESFGNGHICINVNDARLCGCGRPGRVSAVWFRGGIISE